MSSAKTYSFDSVGDRLPTLREHEKNARDVVEIRYNPKLPLTLSPSKEELFVMNKDLASAVSDNIKNILLTNRGERVMQPDFGANLKPILSEYGSPGFESEVMIRIKSSVKKYLPYVSLSSMKLENLQAPRGSGLKIVQVDIEYLVPTLGLGKQNISVTLSTVI